MNILVIKQTSLGDVLHSTGHIRTIKENFPNAHVTLLTADSSADIYRHNPWVDAIILFERYRVKREFWQHPRRTLRYLARVLAQVRAQPFDLAFDLQGLGKSVLFLYAARAKKKYVKGNWLGLKGFRNPSLHAIAEMDGVLRQARLRITDTSMEIFTDAAARRYVDDLLAQINPEAKPLLIFSPFSRWRSKDWPLHRYIHIARRLADAFTIVLTATAQSRHAIDQGLAEQPNPCVVNLAGRLSIPQFAELVGRARAMLCGDSFPMHLACAQHIPVVALFGPTDESKVGPVNALSKKRLSAKTVQPPTAQPHVEHLIIRAPNCSRCDRRNCRRYCLGQLPTATVLRALTAQLGR